MKIKMIFSALTIAVLFSACSDKDGKGDIPTTAGDTKSVFLQISTNQAGTYADESSATGTTAPLLSAIIYFLDSSTDPVVYTYRTVGGTGADISLTQLQNGYEFDDIPAVVTQVYVVGNYNSADAQGSAPEFPTIDAQTLSDIQEVVINIQELAYPELSDGTDAGQLLSIMDGISGISTYDTGGTNTWQGTAVLTDGDLYAEVPISPINARIEIEQISYTGELASFTLEGIYINYYYPEMTLELDSTAYTVTNNGSAVNAYDINNAAFAYNYYTTLYDTVDEGVTVTGGAATITPTSTPNGTWAYHVFGNSNPVPHIILKLTNVLTDSGTNLGTRYVTVRGYSNGGMEVVEFERNTIYKILDLAFTDRDITIVPEPENVSLWVHVRVLAWTTLEVTPIL